MRVAALCPRSLGSSGPPFAVLRHLQRKRTGLAFTSQRRAVTRWPGTCFWFLRSVGFYLAQLYIFVSKTHCNNTPSPITTAIADNITNNTTENVMAAAKLFNMLFLLVFIGFVSALPGFGYGDSSSVECSTACQAFHSRCLDGVRGPEFCRDLVCEYYSNKVSLHLFSSN
jgi:hypothetical protein